MSIKNKLNRLKVHMQTGSSSSQLNTPIKDKQKELPHAGRWDAHGVHPQYFDGDYCLIKEIRYQLDYKHGNYTFAQFADAVSAWNEAGIEHPLSAAGHQPSDLFFFDTETTGLGGGAGNTIFLLGHASLSGDEIVLKQHLLAEPGAEVPLYKSFLESIDYTTMVTYNGKAFDWPQVKTRHTFIRDEVPKLPPFGHFDLYHAARRMWKHKLDRLKLSIVEKDILGFERIDDIPGFLAPMIYFDYVERKEPEGLLGIMKHNELDILSLITLYTHLSFQLLQLDQKQTAREVYETGRWYATLGESAAAEAAFTKIKDGGGIDAFEAKHRLAFEWKKAKKIEQAIPLWKEAVLHASAKSRLEASIELAKYYEHKEKDFEQALYYCQTALEVASSIMISGAADEELNKRKARLIRKI